MYAKTQLPFAPTCRGPGLASHPYCVVLLTEPPGRAMVPSATLTNGARVANDFNWVGPPGANATTRIERATQSYPPPGVSSILFTSLTVRTSYACESTSTGRRLAGWMRLAL